MSWITRCPDCDTVYKVESEQLQQAHGWLRCGTCQHVFDSAGRVVAADVIPTLTDRVNVGAPQLGRVDLERLLHKESPSPAPTVPLPVASEEPHVAPTVEETSPIAAFEDALQSFKMPEMRAAPAAPAVPAVPDEDALKEDPEPVAHDHAQPASAKRSTSGLVLWLLWLMAIAVLLQVLLALRPAILTQWPQWGRWASQWCSTSACRAQWQPPLSLWSLQAQPLTLDGSGYRLAWSLSHSASGSLPVPDLDLSLLNAQGQTVSNQRLTGFMTSAPYVLGARQTWQGTLRVDLAPDVDASRAQLRLIAR
ncbi:DUF3426 domain-containing protein [Limnohabitans radicicola]|uniref:Zinc-ribbon domain-containing protein n=1 Tax=Limnohabitans radicicola TaxID=2771427 RepID=A0A927FJX4_9BURK|nr:DUF3426 domain-containing protein [Limnohabitans radicicola]MBD8051448.1 zinc-ribbon domain-containing protein [Limnohabitans radicicola]